MLTLQMYLAEANRKLAEASTKFGPESPEVSRLKQEVTGIQARSRPIPSEPVYEGRTLSDWLAQMRFEQQTDAKKHAARSVAELSVTRPGIDGLQLALESGNLVLGVLELERDEGSATAFDDALMELLADGDALRSNTRTVLSIPVGHLKKMDRAAASRSLSEMLLGRDLSEQNYALLLLARMHDQMSEKEDGWQAAYTALSELSRTGDEKMQVYARTVFTACIPDAAAAVRSLEKADAGDASYITMLSWFHLERDRKLIVPPATQLNWLGEYLLKIPLGDTRHLQAVINEPILGPLRGVNWSEPTSRQRDVVSAAAERLIDVLQEETIRTDLTPEQEWHVSGHSSTLCQVIDHVALNQTVKDAALTVRNLRLKRLLELRARHDSSIRDWLVDSPSQVAVAITLLSGHAPKLLKNAAVRGGDQKSSELRTLTELTIDPRSAFQRSSKSPGFREVMFKWYPHHALKALAEIEVKRVVNPSSRNRSSVSMLIAMHAIFISNARSYCPGS